MLTNAALAAAVLAAPLHDGSAAVRPPGAEVAEFPELRLTLTLPELAEPSAKRTPESSMRATWHGRLGESGVSIGLTVFDAVKLGLREPGDVTELVVDDLRNRAGELDVVGVRFPQGKYGYAPFAALVEAELKRGEASGVQYLLGGLLDGSAYLVHLECIPRPDEDGARALERFLASGIVYDGPLRDPEWTDEEVAERWRRDAPEDTHDDFFKTFSRPNTKKKAAIRTKHYLIMTNSSSGKLFAKKMEENYEEIRKVFPFEDVEGRRLMPVFLFRTPEQYYDYYAKIANTTREAASKSKGHAWRDYYATWYEAPGDPVHIHEMTHQIFHNRLRLSGGGSWYQEGVAEYIETNDNDRNGVARLVEKGEHTPLREFVALESLLYSSEEDVRGGGGAEGHYTLAALLIEFLRESRFGKDRFDEFLVTLGNVPRSDVAKIEAAFRKVYGVGMDEIDREWREYCERR